MQFFDIVVIGAGAAGMMAAIEAGKRGRSVLVIEHNKKAGEKIRISGGGRCNFTHLDAHQRNYISANSKFCISALSQYSQHDFTALVSRYGIAWHQKERGQLFCDGPATQIVAMLHAELQLAAVKIWLSSEVRALGQRESGFLVSCSRQNVTCQSLIVASGGKSIPKMGASKFGYRIAEQFGLRVTPTRPALVPLTFDPVFLANHADLAGVSVEAEVTCGEVSFRDALLFTHRGLSGPAILQISSFWQQGDALLIDLSPGQDVVGYLREARLKNGRLEAVTVLSELLPRRLAQLVVGKNNGRVADLSNDALDAIGDRVHRWDIKPTGSEGYRTAEVTLGGVDTRDLNARTMEARQVKGLFFVGEVVDVTGWLGGYNFQWAWSSGWAAGQVA